ncbi:alpha/beta hydrolase [Microvirga sp. STR05]|uniref:Alpha/beta hydrolase n=1 Tax=Hymenobacter duratus TaxID=2771356 RepID=A0ABR8JEZ3_9BACT|nr:alpha/beta hydrolase [Hymenobacter duratus]MBD2713942.1 alpha/beta hydrolase [Hymenobacter duratus]MBR7948844.1 alpha/beta hydrolase [Microvirga sp. STR05]
MISKKICLAVVCLILPLAALAQPAPRIAVVDGFLQKVSVRPYAGLPYRVSARIKVASDTSGKADAWLAASVMKTRRRSGSFSYLPQKAVANEWRTYTITGTLDKEADSLTIFAGYYLNGRFGFDDFRLEVARGRGQWEPVPLRNSSFEEAAPISGVGLPAGWQHNWPVVGFTRQLATDSTGNRFLQIDGHDIVRYGHNLRAGRYATVNGARLYYETYGAGEPLLLLHGNGESISSFQSQIGALAQEYQVIAVDTRDQGQSGSTKGPLTYDLFADDMHALLDTLRIPAAHIVGWSDGGNTGLSMALRYPQQVRTLVTMGANLYSDTTAVVASMLHQVRQDQLLLTLLGPFKKEWNLGHRLTTMLLKYPQMKPDQLRAITAPVLVLAGEKDIIKEAHTRLIAQHIPQGQVIILPNLTHYAPQENGPLFNETVLNFLRQQRPRN